MTTTTDTSISFTIAQRDFSKFMRLFVDTGIDVLVRDGMVLLATADACLLVAELDDTDVSLSLYISNVRELKKWVRAAGAKSEIHFDWEVGTANFSCDKLGVFDLTFGKAPQSYSQDLADIGYSAFTIPEPLVKAGISVLCAVDHESSRYALGQVLFDHDSVVATDGRRLHVVEVDNLQHRALVPAKVIEWAKHCKDDILVTYSTDDREDLPTDTAQDVRSKKFLCGDLIAVNIEGRYPNWKQVVPGEDDLPHTMTLHVDKLRAACETAKALYSVDRDQESRALKFESRDDGFIYISGQRVSNGICDLPEGSELHLDYRYVLDAIGKAKDTLCCIECNSTLCTVKKTHVVSGAVVVSTGGYDELSVVVMPMAFDN